MCCVLVVLCRDNNYEKIEDCFDKSQKLILVMNLHWELRTGQSPVNASNSTTAVDKTGGGTDSYGEENAVEDPTSEKLVPHRLLALIGSRYRWCQKISWILTLIINGECNSEFAALAFS